METTCDLEVLIKNCICVSQHTCYTASAEHACNFLWIPWTVLFPMQIPVFDYQAYRRYATLRKKKGAWYRHSAIKYAERATVVESGKLPAPAMLVWPPWEASSYNHAIIGQMHYGIACNAPHVWEYLGFVLHSNEHNHKKIFQPFSQVLGSEYMV